MEFRLIIIHEMTAGRYPDKVQAKFFEQTTILIRPCQEILRASPWEIASRYTAFHWLSTCLQASKIPMACAILFTKVTVSFGIL